MLASFLTAGVWLRRSFPWQLCWTPHCSEQVGWDVLEISMAPIVISHASSKVVCYHDRGKTDDLAKAVADRGGYLGVAVIPGFVSESPEATLDDLARHIEHLVSV